MKLAVMTLKKNCDLWQENGPIDMTTGEIVASSTQDLVQILLNKETAA